MDKRALWLYIARFILALSGVAVHYFFARIGGVTGYGTLSLFLSMVLIFNNLTDFGVSLNGPRYLALNDEPDWYHSAQQLRQRLAIGSTVVYVMVAWFLYEDQRMLLLAGVPMIAGFSLQTDWIYRGMGRPDRSAFRQIIQSIGQLVVVASIWFLNGSMLYALGAYAMMGFISYLFGSFRWGGIQLVHRGKGIPLGQFMQRQWPVFAGFMAQNLSYILAVPLLNRLSGAEVAGNYASHFFLFTSLGTLSVITMEVFMARPDLSDKVYGFWMFVFTLLGTFLMLASVWYFPILFGNKGFGLLMPLLWMNIALLWIHACRLFWVNRLLFRRNHSLYGRYNLLSLSLHIGAWLLCLLLKLPVSPVLALLFLLASESVMMLIFVVQQVKVTHESVS